MRAVIQRVSRAEVRVEGALRGRIAKGLLILLGVSRTDLRDDAEWLARKVISLRVFDDGQGKMNLGILESGGEILCVSQFTLYGDCRKGRRPSFDQAASPPVARGLYEHFIQELRSRGARVEVGEFQAMMEVELVNDGPVTLLLDSPKIG
jgi:D-aminoacyl-tRNA deacylase